MSTLSRIAVIGIIGLAFTAAVSGYEVDSLDLHLEIQSITHRIAPFVDDEYVIFTAEGPFRFVGIAFEHESFAIVHKYEKNRNGIFVFVFPIPRLMESPLFYRLIIDGIWTHDISNPLGRIDEKTGFRLSYVDVPYLTDKVFGVWNPVQEGSEKAHFWFRSDPGKIVTVCGSFNAWDPFSHEMRETSPGIYEADINLGPGTYYYVFVISGVMVSDPLNSMKLFDRDRGMVVSVLVVPN